MSTHKIHNTVRNQNRVFFVVVEQIKNFSLVVSVISHQPLPPTPITIQPSAHVPKTIKSYFVFKHLVEIINFIPFFLFVYTNTLVKFSDALFILSLFYTLSSASCLANFPKVVVQQRHKIIVKLFKKLACTAYYPSFFLKVSFHFFSLPFSPALHFSEYMYNGETNNLSNILVPRNSIFPIINSIRIYQFSFIFGSCLVHRAKFAYSL